MTEAIKMRPRVAVPYPAANACQEPRGLHVALAKQAVTLACHEARRVGYRPGSPQMIALQRAEHVLSTLKRRW